MYSNMIEHKQEHLKSLPRTETAFPFICMFILPVSGRLFMENWRTQIIIPLKWKICYYYPPSFAMPLCTLMLLSDCLFIIAEWLFSQWWPGQIQKVPRHQQLFPVYDIIVYSPKAPWSMSCLEPGWHSSHRTQGAQVALLSKDMYEWNLLGLVALGYHVFIVSLLISHVSFIVMERWHVVVTFIAGDFFFPFKSVICQHEHTWVSTGVFIQNCFWPLEVCKPYYGYPSKKLDNCAASSIV